MEFLTGGNNLVRKFLLFIFDLFIFSLILLVFLARLLPGVHEAFRRKVGFGPGT